MKNLCHLRNPLNPRFETTEVLMTSFLVTKVHLRDAVPEAPASR